MTKCLHDLIRLSPAEEICWIS